MKQLIQNQVVTFDNHNPGQIANVRGLHMHKKMMGKKFKGVDIKIPFNPEEDIYYPESRSEDAKYIINEIKQVFKKDKVKLVEFAQKVSSIIESYSQSIPKNDRNNFMKESAQTLAKHLGINEHIRSKIQKEIEDRLVFVITQHSDNEGASYFIKQDIEKKNIKAWGYIKRDK